MKLLKTPYILVLAVLLGSCLDTQSQVPEAVQATFEKMYPGEKDPDWHKDSHGNYESHFKIDGIKYRADFNADGSWIETETNVEKKDLPDAVKLVINEQFPNNVISEIEKVEHHKKGTFYDVEFKRKGKNKDVEITPEGVILNP